MKLAAPLAAIVTGGASGLGEATARMLAAHGVRVAIFDMNRDRAKPSPKRSAASSPLSTSPRRKASPPASMQARAAHGVERILVNCAGIVLGRRTVTKDRDTGVAEAARPRHLPQGHRGRT